MQLCSYFFFISTKIIIKSLAPSSNEIFCILGSFTKCTGVNRRRRSREKAEREKEGKEKGMSCLGFYVISRYRIVPILAFLK